ncbi:hypothetical protein BDY17DRAFT_312385 [Neohortaea acidophila]|uniref:Uncharacterized protein n=1 Tax=Neohortaea acidophila TaxID=245834 RepID=A0A6A6PLG0_9PEZI|nr:uncharacterized protein BDY17DRAFT_312385 [Neohortaea acidophila]KAF2480494.1 hypothetical protein BDY17DRAFT_312385 [Neohortaea acidophila]
MDPNKDPMRWLITSMEGVLRRMGKLDYLIYVDKKFTAFDAMNGEIQVLQKKVLTREDEDKKALNKLTAKDIQVENRLLFLEGRDKPSIAQWTECVRHLEATVARCIALKEEKDELVDCVASLKQERDAQGAGIPLLEQKIQRQTAAIEALVDAKSKHAKLIASLEQDKNTSTERIGQLEQQTTDVENLKRELAKLIASLEQDKSMPPERIGQLEQKDVEHETRLTSLEQTQCEQAETTNKQTADLKSLNDARSEHAELISQLQQKNVEQHQDGLRALHHEQWQQSGQMSRLAETTNNQMADIRSLNKASSDHAELISQLEQKNVDHEAGFRAFHQTQCDQADQINRVAEATNNQTADIGSLHKASSDHMGLIRQLEKKNVEHEAGLRAFYQTQYGQAGQIGRLAETTDNQTANIETLDVARRDHSEQISWLQEKDVKLETALTSLEQTTQGHANQISELAQTANNRSNVDFLDGKSTEHANLISQLQQKGVEHDDGFKALEQRTREHEVRVSQLGQTADNQTAGIKSLDETRTEHTNLISQLQQGRKEQSDLIQAQGMRLTAVAALLERPTPNEPEDEQYTTRALPELLQQPTTSQQPDDDDTHDIALPHQAYEAHFASLQETIEALAESFDAWTQEGDEHFGAIDVRLGSLESARPAEHDTRFSLPEGSIRQVAEGLQNLIASSKQELVAEWKQRIDVLAAQIKDAERQRKSAGRMNEDVGPMKTQIEDLVAAAANNASEVKRANESVTSLETRIDTFGSQGREQAQRDDEALEQRLSARLLLADEVLEKKLGARLHVAEETAKELTVAKERLDELSSRIEPEMKAEKKRLDAVEKLVKHHRHTREIKRLDDLTELVASRFSAREKRVGELGAHISTQAREDGDKQPIETDNPAQKGKRNELNERAAPREPGGSKTRSSMANTGADASFRRTPEPTPALQSAYNNRDREVLDETTKAKGMRRPTGTIARTNGCQLTTLLVDTMDAMMEDAGEEASGSQSTGEESYNEDSTSDEESSAEDSANKEPRRSARQPKPIETPAGMVDWKAAKDLAKQRRQQLSASAKLSKENAAQREESSNEESANEGPRRSARQPKPIETPAGMVDWKAARTRAKTRRHQLSALAKSPSKNASPGEESSDDEPRRSARQPKPVGVPADMVNWKAVKDLAKQRRQVERPMQEAASPKRRGRPRKIVTDPSGTNPRRKIIASSKAIPHPVTRLSCMEKGAPRGGRGRRG